VLPTGDVGLHDGRTLRSAGPAPGGHGRAWTSSEGLMVVAHLEPGTDRGPSLIVSVGYPRRFPRWHDVQAVRRAFFAADANAAVWVPGPDAVAHATMLVIAEVAHGWPDPPA
jgi:hypothetical protein